jgi:hypothetical protein
VLCRKEAGKVVAKSVVREWGQVKHPFLDPVVKIIGSLLILAAGEEEGRRSCALGTLRGAHGWPECLNLSLQALVIERQEKKP